jgi:phage minor structural protein
MRGIHFGDITVRSIILAKPNPYDDPQPFRVYEITKPMDGVVTFYARHLSYDLDGLVCQPFTASSITDAFSKFISYAAVACPFSFSTDKTTAATMSVKVPETIRTLMGGREGSIIDVYRGEYFFDKFNVRLLNHRGSDRGFVIRYGKNLTDIKQEENCANCYTGVYPYWAGEENNSDILIQLPERVIAAPGNYDYTRILPLDMSSDFENKPTVSQLRNAANQYISDNNIGEPHVSITVSFAMLGHTEEYSHIAALERVSLGDTVGVHFMAMGILARARCIKTIYDALRDKYISVALGDAKNTFERTLAGQTAALIAAAGASQNQTSRIAAAVDTAITVANDAQSAANDAQTTANANTTDISQLQADYAALVVRVQNLENNGN